jgi:hypothetical protein
MLFVLTNRTHSTAKHLHRWRTPAFAALYAAWNCGMFTICPLVLDVAMKLPQVKPGRLFFCSRQILPAVRAQFKTPSTSVLIALW